MARNSDAKTELSKPIQFFEDFSQALLDLLNLKNTPLLTKDENRNLVPFTVLMGLRKISAKFLQKFDKNYLKLVKGCFE